MENKVIHFFVLFRLKGKRGGNYDCHVVGIT
jgi:hypothetical protein